MSSNISKKAVVIGGSNGIGLAIVIKLVSEGYFVEILDREEPEEGQIPTGSYEYHFCDLLYLNEEYISSIASDKSVEYGALLEPDASVTIEPLKSVRQSHKKREILCQNGRRLPGAHTQNQSSSFFGLSESPLKIIL